jgi:hypothetical protein
LKPNCTCCAKYAAYIVAALGTLLIVGALVRVMVDYTRPAAPTEERATLRYKNLQDLRNANAEVLDSPSYAWQDQTRGIVRMPLNDAMALSLKMWRDNKDAARSNLVARAEKASAALPKPPEKPSQFE